MQSDTRRLLTSRTIFLLVGFIGIAWQIYVIALADRYAEDLRMLLASLGAEPPLITKAFLMTYRWWFLAPVVASCFVGFLGRRRQIPFFAGLLALLVAIVPGLALQAWMNEAWFSPLFSLIRQIG